jgi:tetratricopeptide (TPR) repeat protein
MNRMTQPSAPPCAATRWQALVCLCLLQLAISAFGQAAGPGPKESVLLTLSGEVGVKAVGSNDFAPGQPKQVLQLGDQVKTGKNSRASIRMSDLSVLRVYELTTLEIKPPSSAKANEVIDVKAGATYFFNRDKPQETQFQTPSASGAIRGTEFTLVVGVDGRTELSLLDGQVDLTNPQGSVQLQSGEQGIVETGQAPRKTALINAVNIMQWTLYYPAALDSDELDLDAPTRTALADSLAAYRQGDLLQALAKYPTNRVPATQSEQIYQAALLLAVGKVDAAKTLLPDSTATPRLSALANALREMIATVKGEKFQNAIPSTLSATEFLSGSYTAQARGDLATALAKARSATTSAPNFGFAWERLAELEFGFGRSELALSDLEKALQLSQRNAEALALKGFLLSAQNKIPAALSWFDQAIAVDAGLGNAWLGRGLCLIHQGRRAEGSRDLILAASLEPQRGILRSYLGKAFTDAGDDTNADKELKLARQLDANDPTAWLYSALLKQQEDRVNEAMADLQTSQERNDNRSLFRSSLLLDSDRAVGSANLASIYRDLGMTDVSVREAARAVNEDYANHSAHLFLSDSYYNLLDPTQFNLRYDTVWFNELLLANILSPVGGGRLAQGVSQQEYSKLFQADGVGVASSSEVRTDGMFHELASQYGTYGNTSYAVDLDYHHNDGVRVNNSLDNVLLNYTLKQQITPQDTALLLVQQENYHSGDNFQYYYQTNARPYYEFTEEQQPELVGAWHHQWGPGMHTLLLVGRLVDQQNFSDRADPEFLFSENGAGAITGYTLPTFNVNYTENFEIYSAELSQICEWDRVTLLAGTRYQSGTFQTQDELTSPAGGGAFFFPKGPITASTSSLFQRETAYTYLTIEPVENLWLTGGATADNETYPSDFRQPPIGPGENTKSQLGPKAALVWSPVPQATLRGIYTRSLGGVSVDQSYRLEPTQLAGFPQAFRSLISESIVGSQSAPTFETLGAALDLKLGTRTYAGIQLERLGSKVNQGIGDFVFPNGGLTPVTSSEGEYFDYTEHTLALTLNQLIGDQVVVGTSYHITQSDLRQSLPGISPAVSPPLTYRANLHTVNGYALLSHPSGFFARAEVDWYGQSNAGFSPAEPDVSFFQENIFAGYRFARRRAELQLGILNLSGGGYNLDPLTVYQELPRKRVFDARFNFIF